jgi:hypothetical protein
MTTRFLASLLAVVGVVLVIGTGCGLGDNSHNVTYRNLTDLPLLVYGSDPTKADTKRVPAGATVESQWLVPAVWSGTISGPPRLVQASTEGGERVFCHKFSFDELERLKWLIEITRRDDCS